MSGMRLGVIALESELFVCFDLADQMLKRFIATRAMLTDLTRGEHEPPQSAQ